MSDLKEIITLASNGENNLAEERLRRLLDGNGLCFDAWNLLSFVLLQEGKLSDAIKALLITIDRSTDPCLKMVNDAISSINQKLKIDSKLLVIAGKAMIETNNPGKAISYFKRALEIDQNNPDAQNNLAVAFFQTGKYREAFDANEKALSLDPNHKNALNTKGCLYFKLGQNSDALAIFRKLAAIDPENLDYANNLGVALSYLFLNCEAIELYQGQIERHPDYHLFKYNLAYLLLMQGDCKTGFPLYEYRSKIKELSLQLRQVDSPRWQGEKIDGKKILVRCEQGFGDSIQFLRYVPFLERCQIIIELQPELHCLFQHYGFLLTCPNEGAPEHDVHVDMMSFPYLFKTDLSSIPPPISLQAQLQPVKNRTGIAWKGNSINTYNKRKSLNIDALNSILQIPGIDFVSLQKDLTQEEERLLDERSVFRPELRSFTDTLYQLEKCERVICTDTVIAHLAGSMGIPTWILIPFVPDWRWLQNRRDSPWYPSARLFRQSVMDSWPEPIVEIRNELKD